ncbi:MAG: D-glycerate dehydrogenase [Candidatus Melainabacteria bacterium]|nr:D-glycerate dehydrogenase [Candidatus Melainabacteria bacterium]
MKVLVFGRLSGPAAEKLASVADFSQHDRDMPLPEAEIERLVGDVDAVLSEPLDGITAGIMDRCPRLRMISNRAVGFDNVDIEEASHRGIIVCNTPGVLDDATADLAFALLLAASRRVCEADRYVRQGRWTGFKSDLMLGPDIFGKTMGIIGMGRIGRAFALRARAFGMKIIYTSASGRREKENSQELGARRVSLEELLRESDFISVHCPLKEDTRHLIKKKELELMKPGAVLVNTARGAVIDQDALVAHLEAGRIFAAGLDVFEDEPNVPERLKTLDNVVLTPHIGSACVDTRERMTSLAVDAIVDAFAGRQPAHMVNPSAWEKFNGK